jgi:molybdopterin synthase catalytic subunit
VGSSDCDISAEIVDGAHPDIPVATVRDTDGAAVTFLGVVRARDHARPVTQLEYVAHPSAATILLAAAHTISSSYPDVSSIRVAHRIGLLEVGDWALWAQTASPHRLQAFQACSALVDEVKRTLPIWKRQVFLDGGEEWVNSP